MGSADQEGDGMYENNEKIFSSLFRKCTCFEILCIKSYNYVVMHVWGYFVWYILLEVASVESFEVSR